MIFTCFFTTYAVLPYFFNASNVRKLYPGHKIVDLTFTLLIIVKTHVHLGISSPRRNTVFHGENAILLSCGFPDLFGC